ncbi:hypothetical protein HYFRA_00006011 [Hymenoscyphus fraxineus]|uniref:Uncharacterized protein n=1 Tax=Hymenoscyphus fraxineus TaxID=746836 RepID=A0A9N9KVR9_9HELO|nr:hypothetical protein HYFRA_00006011 [Hymenoscyphus fraxineus]
MTGPPMPASVQLCQWFVDELLKQMGRSFSFVSGPKFSALIALRATVNWTTDANDLDKIFVGGLVWRVVVMKEPDDPGAVGDVQLAGGSEVAVAVPWANFDRR